MVETGSKTCAKCGQTKSLNEFYHARGRNGTLYPKSRCKPCMILDSKASNRRRLAKQYDMTLSEYEATIRSAGKCSICGNTERLVMDHCHAKGNVRGVLCSNCNTALGLFRDSTELLLRAAQYINGNVGD